LGFKDKLKAAGRCSQLARLLMAVRCEQRLGTSLGDPAGGVYGL